ncbi:MAG TPA: hypothetical protein DDZ51_12800 [Planctomycetaceae bacterium]|nr:hypothetical protein [Planctomycetaceae bacterium]
MAIFVASFVGISAAMGNGPVVVPTVQPDWVSAAVGVASETADESSQGQQLASPVDGLDAAALQTELDQLRQRLSVLEQQAEQTLPAKVEPELEAKSRADVFETSGGKWTTRLGGHIQSDYITWADADPAIADTENYFSFRRLRLVAEGVGYEQFDFRLQMTLEPGSGSTSNIFASPDVKDAYVTMNDIPVIGRARVGNFFVPFSLEQVTNDTNNIFNERSIPTETVFAASREIGIAFYNATEDERITWATGAFFDNINDTIKTRLDDNQGLRLAGRLTGLPYYYEPSNGRHLVHTGVGVLHTHDHDGLVRFFARPQIQRGPILIDSGNLPADSYTTGNIEYASVWGPIAIQAEAFLASVNLDTGGKTTINGSYAHVSYFLTGENRNFERFGQHGAQFGRAAPNTNFFITPKGIGMGGLEAKARWSNLNLTNLGSGEYNDFTFGFNWYWSDRTRWMFDWIHPVTSGQTVFGDTESDLLAMRFDVNW